MEKQSISMKIVGLLIISYMCFMQPKFAFTQSAKLEVNPYIRYDNYPQISYQIDQLTRVDTLKMAGSSYGVNLNYVIPGFSNGLFKIGLGYYRYSFTEVSTTRIGYGPNANGREIQYPSPTTFLFLTDRYWYHTFNVSLAYERKVVISKTINLHTGIGVSNYFTFSQYYHISAGDIDFGNSRFGYFGSSLALSASLLKGFNKVQIGPSLVIPLVDTWKKDMLLPENYEREFRWKYLNGFGIGITFSYSLGK